MEKTYKIEVDCANCAATIERHVAKLKCVKEVTVSYMAPVSYTHLTLPTILRV